LGFLCLYQVLLSCLTSSSLFHFAIYLCFDFIQVFVSFLTLFLFLCILIKYIYLFIYILFDYIELFMHVLCHLINCS
jgi:hypothetical protein